MLDPEQYAHLKEKIAKYFFNTGHKCKASSTQMMLILAELLVMTLKWTLYRQMIQAGDAKTHERKP